MTAPPPFQEANLASYDTDLHRGLALSGENKSFFAQGRIAWLARRLQQLNVPQPQTILDFGCGAGDTALLLCRQWPSSRVIGVDPSVSLLEEARKMAEGTCCQFLLPEEVAEKPLFDLVYCNGVFHHIPPKERLAALQWIRTRLQPGGFFSFWENNPWNPAARWVMRRIPFDRDAVLLSSIQARYLLHQAGYEFLCQDYLFIFPHILRWARPVEPWLCKLPLGTQYHLLSRLPGG